MGVKGPPLAFSAGCRYAQSNPHRAYDQRIDGGDTAAGADQRVEVEFPDEVALVGDEFGGAANNVTKKRKIDPGQPTIALQQQKAAQFAQ